MTPEKTQEIYRNIEFFAALASSTGIDEDNKALCNGLIKNLIEAIQPEVAKITAASAGVIIN